MSTVSGFTHIPSLDLENNFMVEELVLSSFYRGMKLKSSSRIDSNVSNLTADPFVTP